MSFNLRCCICKGDLRIRLCRIPDKEAAASGTQSACASSAGIQQRHPQGILLHLHCLLFTFPKIHTDFSDTFHCSHLDLVNRKLQALLEFLQRVIDHKERNKMTLNNVAMVMAPNIFMFKGFRSKITGQQEFTMATSMANIVRLLIRYQDLLCTVCTSLYMLSSHISNPYVIQLNERFLLLCHFCSRSRSL